MTVNQDAQKLIDEALAAGHLTTVGYINKHWKVPPEGTNWAVHEAKLAAARKLLDPVAPPPVDPPPTTGKTPAPIVPPSAYTVPAGAVAVRTSAELITALAGSNNDVVLEDGTYDTPSNTNFVAGAKRVYARNVGKAILKAGIAFGNTSGYPSPPKLQGVVIDTVAAKCMNSAAVNPWGAGAKGFQMLDCVVRGNKSVAYGVNCYSPQDTVWERNEFYGFTDVGLRVSTNQADATTIKRIRDILVDGVTRNPVNSSNGTAEAGLFIGHKVVEGVARIRIRNVSWSGIETVNVCKFTIFTDFDIDLSGIPTGVRVGVYMEHSSEGDTFQKFLVVGCKTGFNGEWADPAAGGTPGAKDVTIKEGKIVGGRAGVNLDDGSGPGNLIVNVDFVGQTWAAVGAFNNRPNPTITGCTYALAPGAVPFSTNHI